MREALFYETAELLLMAIVILAGAHFIKALGDTFHVRNTYTETLTVVTYGLSPVFLFRLLDVFPTVNLCLPWAIGIMLTAKILYHGVPRIMHPDPPVPSRQTCGRAALNGFGSTIRRNRSSLISVSTFSVVLSG